MDAFGRPFDAGAHVGEEVVVQGAAPTSDERGWIIDAWVGTLEAEYEFPEEALESAGVVEREDAEGATRRLPLDEVEEPWEDDVQIVLRTETKDRAQAAAIAARAAEALHELPHVRDVEWHLTEWQDEEPVWATMWVWSDGDALEAFAGIVSLTDTGWAHDEDERVFISSEWRRPPGDEFLAPGIQEADVCYRRWTSPRRRSRAELPRQHVRA